MTDSGETFEQAVGKIASRVAPSVIDFLSRLAAESERSVVILSAARLDASLESLLKAVLHSSPGGSDDLFAPERPLGSLSAKISLAYRMGLVDRDLEHVLQMIRRIRNDFAHSFGEESLSHQKQVQRLAEAIRTARQYALWPLTLETLARLKGPSATREFTALMVLAITRLETYAHLVDKFAGPMATLGGKKIVTPGTDPADKAS